MDFIFLVYISYGMYISARFLCDYTDKEYAKEGAGFIFSMFFVYAIFWPATIALDKKLKESSENDN